MTWDDELLAFQADVRAFLESELPADLRGSSDQYHCSDKSAIIRWKEILRQKGWLAAHWPVEFGGCGWSEEKQWIFRHECARARTPLMDMHGMRMVGPAICRFGTPAQSATYLPAILESRHWWCQGFSEPGSGSDLLSLRTRAARTPSGYVVEGEKIWTTYAHISTHMFTLVRTTTEGRPSEQLSLLLIALSSPGVSVYPIVSIDNQHHFNRVVLDRVEVSEDCRLGTENEGWAIAKFLLETERLAGAASEVCAAYLAVARSLVSVCAPDTETARQLGTLEIRYQGLIATERRAMAGQGDIPASVASCLKILGADLQKDVAEFCLLLLGHDAGGRPAPASGGQIGSPASGAMERFCYSRAASIYGGSNEIQKGIIARALGL